jgi:hypothetical protein
MRTMKKSLKRSLLIIAGVLVAATLAVFAQSATVEKLYKNEQEKKELVTAIMQDQELSGEITEKLMGDMECCKEMMAGKNMMKMCSKMMASMENHSSMCNMMMGKEDKEDEKPQQGNKADENRK